jgi:hypothetical protein
LRAIYFAASPFLSTNLLVAAIGSRLAPKAYADRLETLESQNVIMGLLGIEWAVLRVIAAVAPVGIDFASLEPRWNSA